jgi:cytoskeletal protein CcmA (bactofilin family)
MANTVRPEAPSKVTVVEEGTAFKGTLTSSCPIDVRGKVEGELETPSLTVSSTGAVHGRAKVGAVRSQGELSGEFDADSIELSGVVRDNTVIRARSLDVKLVTQQGRLQIAFGACELSVGDEPTEHDRELENAAKQAAAAAAVPMPAPAPEPAPMAAEAPAMPAAALLLAPEASTGAAVSAEPAASEAQAEEAEGWDGDAEAEGAEAGAGGGKRRRKRKNGHEEKAGWSHPPSQPPPAS